MSSYLKRYLRYFSCLYYARHFKLSCSIEIWSFSISTSFDLMADEKKTFDPALSEFYEAMERTNVEKIAHETLARILEGSSDSEDFDVESENEDVEDRPWRPSHVVFEKSTIKQGQIDAMKGRYFCDISIVRAGGESNVPLPEADEVVVYRSFMKAGLQFPLDSVLVEVLKTFEVYLHQLTPEAIIKIGVYVWAIRSQGLEPNAKCFCNMHELSYETKATGKEQYHNNFSCCGFVTRSEVSNPVPTFRKRWPRAWMQEWFYVNNDLVEREDIKGIIQRPIWSHFGIRRQSLALGNDIQTCQATYNTVCTYIGTRDLVQEHIAYKVWSLESGWEMPKEAAAGSSQGGLIYLKYKFKYKSQFDESNDDLLDAIDATSDELLGAYSRAKDDAMTTAFRGRGKKRLNRVFHVIGFVYPDYSYPLRKQEKKRRAAASTISTTPKTKKVKVLTHRPKCIETAGEPRPAEGSSVFESSYPAPAEAKTEPAEEPKLKIAAERLKALSPLQETELPKVQRIASVTPKRRRMTSVLDAVIESTRALTPASVEAPSAEGENTKKSAEADIT
jgi:hypothetical protein